MSFPHRRLLVPEVVQCSGMDCGPAALKSFLEGHGISLSYGRLREACQTHLDGTAIETLEELATGLGAPVEQVLLPKDLLLLAEARAFPAIAVFRLPNGNTHFAVIWRVLGPAAQVMDPAYGRRWLSRRGLLEELYEHVMTVPASDWRAWAASGEALALQRRRLRDLGVSAEASSRLLEEALADDGYGSLAALDASLRLAAASGGDPRPLFERARLDPTAIPRELWSVRPEDDDPGRLVVRGAVVLRPAAPAPSMPPISLPPAIVAAREEPRERPLRELWRWVREDGLRSPSLVAAAAIGSGSAIVAEALFFRAALEVPGLVPALAVFLLIALALDSSSLTGQLRMGRRLETRLRRAFQRKLPRLSDRYFASRLTSDMAERQHSLHGIRKVPAVAGQILREGSELLLTGAAIVWLAPEATPWVAAACLAAVAVPLAGQPFLHERDSRVRSHVGALSRFYLDALLGLVPLRVHGAEEAIRIEHESVLSSWARARLALQRTAVTLEALQFALGYGLIVGLVFSYLRGGGDPARVLLLAYWALNLPVLGLQLVRLLRRYPEARSIFLRVTEPLSSPEERDAAPRAEMLSRREEPSAGFSIRLESASVRVAGHRLLESIDLAIDPGAHVAVVGRSGAGKSTLFGLLLGFHFPEEGRVVVGGSVLSGERLAFVRSRIAWVDPAVQLWNESLEENLRFGADDGDARSLEWTIEAAGLRPVLDALPEEEKTRLGEGGALVSGGEGQRVRLARALRKRDVRLALLDEPFRGLDRASRRELLRRSRELWKDATLLAVTHDLGEAESFDRVLVLEGGRLVEDGAPSDLLRDGKSRYRKLLEAERKLDALWADGSWRSWRIVNGEVLDAT